MQNVEFKVSSTTTDQNLELVYKITSEPFGVNVTENVSCIISWNVPKFGSG